VGGSEPLIGFQQAPSMTKDVTFFQQSTSYVVQKTLVNGT